MVEDSHKEWVVPEWEDLAWAMVVSEVWDLVWVECLPTWEVWEDPEWAMDLVWGNNMVSHQELKEIKKKHIFYSIKNVFKM
jgi:hypothetical protein